MTLPSIALFGYAGSGKDTVAEYLVKTYQYTRIALADPLKEMAIQINPIVGYRLRNTEDYNDYDEQWEVVSTDVEPIRLADAVNEIGWERVKREYPESRVFLRSLGATMRDRDPDYWLDIALLKIQTAAILNMPVVVTDVRYENEFTALRDGYDFTTARIDRPDIDTSDVDPESGRLIESVTPDWLLVNDGSTDLLHSRIESLIMLYS